MANAPEDCLLKDEKIDGNKGKKEKKLSEKLKMRVYQAAMQDTTDKGEQDEASYEDEDSSAKNLDSS